MIFLGIRTNLGPGDVDGDLVESPNYSLRTGWGGEAARITVILTHVVLRQETQQREWLHFSRLALRKRCSHVRNLQKQSLTKYFGSSF